jgi:hypothetical protein
MDNGQLTMDNGQWTMMYKIEFDFDFNFNTKKQIRRQIIQISNRKEIMNHLILIPF